MSVMLNKMTLNDPKEHKRTKLAPRETSLLYSCSTLNLLADSALLDDIQKVDKTMQVRCNMGTTKTNLMG
jgi:hypothetical protein